MPKITWLLTGELHVFSVKFWQGTRLKFWLENLQVWTFSLFHSIRLFLNFAFCSIQFSMFFGVEWCIFGKNKSLYSGKKVLRNSVIIFTKFSNRFFGSKNTCSSPVSVIAKKHAASNFSTPKYSRIRRAAPYTFLKSNFWRSLSVFYFFCTIFYCFGTIFWNLPYTQIFRGILFYKIMRIF